MTKSEYLGSIKPTSTLLIKAILDTSYQGLVTSATAITRCSHTNEDCGFRNHYDIHTYICMNKVHVYSLTMSQLDSIHSIRV